eukprot:TRINITY_DN59447_c0_g1_i1.p1 TRINITY_DN59447_c0_g1~~TRINITY_DN59447_c0_g1_i1.p1  ORF type:complete len:368 (+),score=53.77 TRINITY_DN59447_c0_g1_i1:38-1141(+)
MHSRTAECNALQTVEQDNSDNNYNEIFHDCHHVRYECIEEINDVLINIVQLLHHSKVDVERRLDKRHLPFPHSFEDVHHSLENNTSEMVRQVSKIKHLLEKQPTCNCSGTFNYYAADSPAKEKVVDRAMAKLFSLANTSPKVASPNGRMVDRDHTDCTGYADILENWGLVHNWKVIFGVAKRDVTVGRIAYKLGCPQPTNDHVAKCFFKELTGCDTHNDLMGWIARDCQQQKVLAEAGIEGTAGFGMFTNSGQAITTTTKVITERKIKYKQTKKTTQQKPLLIVPAAVQTTTKTTVGNKTTTTTTTSAPQDSPKLLEAPPPERLYCVKCGQLNEELSILAQERNGAQNGAWWYFCCTCAAICKHKGR